MRSSCCPRPPGPAPSSAARHRGAREIPPRRLEGSLVPGRDSDTSSRWTRGDGVSRRDVGQRGQERRQDHRVQQRAAGHPHGRVQAAGVPRRHCQDRVLRWPPGDQGRVREGEGQRRGQEPCPGLEVGHPLTQHRRPVAVLLKQKQ
uniref:Uncharacterized protein n=1 Tax=Myotis myotis TaxID=51298 RepID=A0A7J7WVN2_MYOMY|nr:hypothetical protein mMyoMyo1_011862 [Myotis myotis]